MLDRFQRSFVQQGFSSAAVPRANLAQAVR